jgi:hypothetical protein
VSAPPSGTTSRYSTYVAVSATYFVLISAGRLMCTPSLSALALTCNLPTTWVAFQLPLGSAAHLMVEVAQAGEGQLEGLEQPGWGSLVQRHHRVTAVLQVLLCSTLQPGVMC